MDAFDSMSDLLTGLISMMGTNILGLLIAPVVGGFGAQVGSMLMGSIQSTFESSISSMKEGANQSQGNQEEINKLRLKKKGFILKIITSLIKLMKIMWTLTSIKYII